MTSSGSEVTGSRYTSSGRYARGSIWISGMEASCWDCTDQAEDEDARQSQVAERCGKGPGSSSCCRQECAGPPQDRSGTHDDDGPRDRERRVAITCRWREQDGHEGHGEQEPDHGDGNEDTIDHAPPATNCWEASPQDPAEWDSIEVESRRMRWRDTPRRCAPPSSGIGSDVAEFCSDGCVERHVAHRLFTGHHDFNVEVLDAEYGFVEHVTQRRMWTPSFEAPAVGALRAMQPAWVARRSDPREMA